MEKRILREDTCHYCQKTKNEFTMWPSSLKYGHLVCDDCAEDLLTPEAYKERTGKTSKKEKTYGHNKV